MSYYAEKLEDLSPSDLRAWAFAQTTPGNCAEVRIAEARVILSWALDGEGVPAKERLGRAGSSFAHGVPAEFDSSCFQVDSTTSDSSSGCADGESTGELPTPSCKKIVIPKDRVDGFTYDGAGNLVVTLKNGGW